MWLDTTDPRRLVGNDGFEDANDEATDRQALLSTAKTYRSAEAEGSSGTEVDEIGPRFDFKGGQ